MWSRLSQAAFLLRKALGYAAPTEVAVDKSRYHKFALSFRQSGEQKAQSCEIA